MSDAEAEFASWIAALKPVPVMYVDGFAYREVVRSGCSGCAFIDINCNHVSKPARLSFGDECQNRGTIYIMATQ